MPEVKLWLRPSCVIGSTWFDVAASASIRFMIVTDLRFVHSPTPNGPLGFVFASKSHKP